MNRIDIVTVFHNETNRTLHHKLLADITKHESDGGIGFFAVDNRTHNRGFSAGCNLGATHPAGTAPIIGFLNPDCDVTGPFINAVTATLNDQVVITGCRYGKPDRELQIWGVRDWVCGAALFVRRKWFTGVGGFDEQFVWSHEETDLIRRAEKVGRQCRSIVLPIQHRSPDVDSPEDVTYKHYHFEQGRQRYYRKWGK